MFDGFSVIVNITDQMWLRSIIITFLYWQQFFCCSSDSCIQSSYLATESWNKTEYLYLAI